ncbi:hypothetical protein C8Q76DRAFT_585293, partial [Earliella scabrosa]
LCRMPVEIGAMVADDMDVVSLLAWRACCRALYHEATDSMRRTLTAALRRFFRYPDALLRNLTEFRAVVGGTLALAFVLRDLSLSSNILQIYVPFPCYRQLVDRLLTCTRNARSIRNQEEMPVARYVKFERDVVAKTVLYLDNGRRAVIYGGAKGTACAPLVRSPLSALATFVTEHTFGCAYPLLTLRRRAIFSDLRLLRMDFDDHEVFGALCRAGFSFAISPTAWEEFRPFPPTALPTRPNSHFCTARWYLCPMQGRFFGDAGSLVGLVDPV